MTYEEYKSNKKVKKSNIFKKLFNKLFTVVIFTIVVITISNFSPKFKDFLINDVLNNSMDFSFMNKITSTFTDVFENGETENVSFEPEVKKEKYKDGIKYYMEYTDEVKLHDSGIVTFLGEKDGLNTIMIQQSNGYYAMYANIKPTVKLYDYVSKNTVIGTSEDYYYFALYKDDKPVDIYSES